MRSGVDVVEVAGRARPLRYVALPVRLSLMLFAAVVVI
jgi:hypothetical protein